MKYRDSKEAAHYRQLVTWADEYYEAYDVSSSPRDWELFLTFEFMASDFAADNEEYIWELEDES